MNESPSSLWRRRVLAVTAAALSLAAVPAFAETVHGSGKVVTQSRQVSGVSGVALGLRAAVDVRVGPSESVTIEADDNLLPLIETSVDGGTLRIRPVRRNLELDSRAIKVVVQTRQVDHLSVGGSGSITAQSVKGAKVQFEVGGSGRIQVQQVEAGDVAAEVGGSGGIQLAGKASKLSVDIGGSGEVVAGDMQVDDARLSIAGSGNATVWAMRSLRASIAGSGDVRYFGDARVSQSVAGSGTVKRLGASPR